MTRATSFCKTETLRIFRLTLKALASRQGATPSRSPTALATAYAAPMDLGNTASQLMVLKLPVGRFRCQGHKTSAWHFHAQMRLHATTIRRPSQPIRLKRIVCLQTICTQMACWIAMASATTTRMETAFVTKMTIVKVWSMHADSVGRPNLRLHGCNGLQLRRERCMRRRRVLVPRSLRRLWRQRCAWMHRQFRLQLRSQCYLRR